MSKYQSVRGTRDLLPEVKTLYRSIESLAYNTARKFGFKDIETPIFEFSDVFHRSLGETSDAISKETYTFTDRGGESITLRPEGTAGVVRAYISEGLMQHNPNKFYYFGPMFRYERPQKGRYRQFYQLGVECLGLETPSADVECLGLAWAILKKLGLSDRCVLEINTLGDQASRDHYRQALVDFLTPLKDQLSEDSKKRLEKNPLRILDSKDEGDKALVKNAPQMQDYLNEDSKTFFSEVIKGLELLKIPYKVNTQLVRGLDYYCHTVFEFVTTELGAQGAILAGGRYDGLSEMLGGPRTPGIGWASGVDRLVELIKLNEKSTFSESKQLTAFVALGDKAQWKAIQIAQTLRENDNFCEVIQTGNFKKKLEKANKLGATAAVLLFEQDNGTIELKYKNFTTGEEVPTTEIDLIQQLNRSSSNLLD